MPEYALVTPFLTDDPTFAYGVEFGMLYATLSRPETREIQDYFCRENQDRILVLAGRLGFDVVTMRRWDEDWFLLRLRRRG
jgi:hypothetical protein